MEVKTVGCGWGKGPLNFRGCKTVKKLKKVNSFDNFQLENAYYFLDFTQSWGGGQTGARQFVGGMVPPPLPSPGATTK